MEDKYIYKELSRQIVGAAFNVYNNTGFGMPEKYVQAAYAEELKELGLKFEREYYLKLKYNEKLLLKRFADFRVEDKVIVELKVRPYLGYVHIKQVQAYLVASGDKLAIILYFTKDGVKFRRVLNPNNNKH
jgi:GxxExxY protein